MWTQTAKRTCRCADAQNSITYLEALRGILFRKQVRGFRTMRQYRLCIAGHPWRAAGVCKKPYSDQMIVLVSYILAGLRDSFRHERTWLFAPADDIFVVRESSRTDRYYRFLLTGWGCRQTTEELSCESGGCFVSGPFGKNPRDVAEKSFRT